MLKALEVFFGIDGLNGDKLSRQPFLSVGERLVGFRSHNVLYVDFFEIRFTPESPYLSSLALKPMRVSSDVHAHVDEVFDALSLEVVHEAGATGHHEEATAV